MTSSFRLIDNTLGSFLFLDNPGLGPNGEVKWHRRAVVAWVLVTT